METRHLTDHLKPRPQKVPVTTDPFIVALDNCLRLDFDDNDLSPDAMKIVQRIRTELTRARDCQIAPVVSYRREDGVSPTISRTRNRARYLQTKEMEIVVYLKGGVNNIIEVTDASLLNFSQAISSNKTTHDVRRSSTDTIVFEAEVEKDGKYRFTLTPS